MLSIGRGPEAVGNKDGGGAWLFSHWGGTDGVAVVAVEVIVMDAVE